MNRFLMVFGLLVSTSSLAEEVKLPALLNVGRCVYVASDPHPYQCRARTMPTYIPAVVTIDLDAQGFGYWEEKVTWGTRDYQARVEIQKYPTEYCAKGILKTFMQVTPYENSQCATTPADFTRMILLGSTEYKDDHWFWPSLTFGKL